MKPPAPVLRWPKLFAGWVWAEPPNKRDGDGWGNGHDNPWGTGNGRSPLKEGEPEW